MSKLVFAMATVALAALAAPAAAQPTYTPYPPPNSSQVPYPNPNQGPYQGQYQNPYSAPQPPQGPYQSPYPGPYQSPYASPYGAAPNYPPPNGQGYGRPGYGDNAVGDPEEIEGYGGRYDAADFDRRLNQIEAGVRNAAGAGRIDANMAAQLHGQANEIRRLERRYGAGGIDQRERLDLQGRLSNLRHDFRVADGRISADDRYGYDDRYYNGAPGAPYEGGNGRSRTEAYGGTNAYGSGSAYNRPNGYVGGSGYQAGNGAPGNGYSGRGGPYEPAQGGCADGGCLRVGDRVGGGLYGVPTEDRDRYHDGNGVYYRSDGRAIYRIDSRTNTVLNVYGMDR